MVLREASTADSPHDPSSLNPSDDPFFKSNQSSPSTYDSSTPSTYDSSPNPSQNPNQKVLFNLPPTPQCYPSMCPGSSFFGFNRESFTRTAALYIANYQKLAGRNLISPELNATLEDLYTGYAYSSYGKPLGLAYASWKLVRGHEKGTFPLQGVWTKAGTYFNSQTGTMFVGGKDRGLLGLPSTQQFRIVLSTARVGLWLSLAYGIGTILGTVYGGTVTAVKMLRDPRLRELHQMMAEKAGKLRQEKAQRRGEAQQQKGIPMPPVERDPTGQGDKPLGEIWKGRPQPASVERIRKNDGDDASPTAGTHGDDDAYWSGFGVGSDTVTQEQEVKPTMIRKSTSSTKREAKKKALKTEEERAAAAFDTPGQPSSSTDGSGGESAWDRIRRESSTGGSSESS